MNRTLEQRLADALDACDPDAVKAALDAGADPDPVRGYYTEPKKPLHQAFENKRNAAVIADVLVKAGANPNIVAHDEGYGMGPSLLTRAVEDHETGFVKALLASDKVDPEFSGFGGDPRHPRPSPIELARQKGFGDIVRAFEDAADAKIPPGERNTVAHAFNSEAAELERKAARLHERAHRLENDGHGASRKFGV